MAGSGWRQHFRSKFDTNTAAQWLALALLDAGRAREARAAIDQDVELAPDKLLTHAILRACVAGALNDRTEFENQLRLVLAVPLAKVDYLAFPELAALFERLWKAAVMLPDDDAFRSNLIDRMLAAGLAHDPFFEPFRAQNDAAKDVHYYRCVIRQPLDIDWPLFQGCLHGQETWDSYNAVWDVLARDEEEAAQFVLNWQSQCYPLDAILASCQAEGDACKERVGVVSQGGRWHEGEPANAALI